jgi:hypothetical protein
VFSLPQLRTAAVVYGRNRTKTSFLTAAMQSGQHHRMTEPGYNRVDLGSVKKSLKKRPHRFSVATLDKKFVSTNLEPDQ